MTKDTKAADWIEVVVGLLVVEVHKGGAGEEAWVVRPDGTRVPVLVDDLGDDHPIRALVEAHRFDLVGVTHRELADTIG